MTVSAAVLFAWMAVHLFMCIYSLILHLRLRSGVAYGGFSLASLGMATYAAGAALLQMAPDLAASAHAQRLQFAGVAIGMPGFAALLYGLLEVRKAVLVPVTFAWATLGLLTNLAGLFFDPAQPISRTWDQPAAALLPAGVAFAFGSQLLTVTIVVDAARRRGPGSRDVRLILGLTVPSMLAWMYDSVVRAFALDAPTVLGHVVLLSSIGVSYVLLGRFSRLDDELRARTRDLRRSYEELQLVQEELVRKEQLAAVGELSAVIANELRIPLDMLRHAVEALSKGDVPKAEEEHLLATLDQETDRLNRLVRDLLTYARPVEPQMEPVPVDDLVRKALRAAEHPSRSGGIRVDVDLEGGPDVIQADADLLPRALSHIIENALQAMPDGGTLTIRSRSARIEGGPALSLSFHDTGEGMDQIVREKARDPFFTTRPSGTGLGLAIVERVAQAHGGTVELQSSYGEGTTATIVLPTERRSSLLPSAPDRASVPRLGEDQLA
ncbi:MAG: two-component system sensor histidine kinase NtrB [Myxococcota bacterium]